MTQYRYWTEEEEETLKRLWINPKVSLEDIERVFVDRTQKAILAKVNQLKLPLYTTVRASKIDKEYLKQLYEVIEG